MIHKKSSPPSRAIQFETSAVDEGGYPPETLPEIAMVGRSNAGKSSFINALARSSVAKVSQTPGKTRLINFFKVKPEAYRIVDLPGYGYAARSHSERDSWREMIENYLTWRRSLVGLVLIMDIRRDWDEEERQLADFAADRALPLIVVLNKSDKMNRSEREKALKNLQKQVPEAQVFCVSAVKKEAVAEVEEFVYKQWIAGASARQPQ